MKINRSAAPSRTRGLAATSLLVGAVVLAGALTIPAAEAAPILQAASANPASTVSSSATAAKATLPSFALAAGSSSTDATSGGSLAATGAGVLAPSPSGEASASTPPGSSKSVPETCGGSLPKFPAPFTGLAAAGLACGSAAVTSRSASAGTASATGRAASASLDLAPLLGQVLQQGSPVVTALEGVIGTLPPLPAGGQTVSSILQTANKALTTQTLSAVLGDSSSSSVVTPAGWSTTAKATGGTITLLPGGGIGGAPLARITVGSASATAGVTRAPSGGGTEHPTASDSPSLVTVEVNAPAVGSRSFSVVPGQSMTILQGTPLQSTISVAAGSVTTSPSGAVTASANGVSLALAEGVGASTATSYDGGLQLTLAGVTATALPSIVAAPAAAASPKTPSAAPLSNPVPNATAPHTGLPWAGAAPLLAGAAALGATLLWWPRRRRPTLARVPGSTRTQTPGSSPATPATPASSSPGDGTGR